MTSICTTEPRCTTCPDEGEGPRFIIYATNLQSGVSFRFSRPYMADYRIGLNRNTAGIRIADAVAASSAFPPILTPKVLETDPGDWEQDPDPKRRGDLWENEDFRRTISLTDGGVYDNMGLEAVFDQTDPLFVSAAGGPFSSEPLGWKDKHSEIGIGLRATGILTEQTRALRRRMVLRAFRANERTGAYWNIASEVGQYGLDDPIIQDSELTGGLQFVRTRLNKFTPQEQGHLMNWGYAIADTAIRKWVVAAAVRQLVMAGPGVSSLGTLSFTNAEGSCGSVPRSGLVCLFANYGDGKRAGEQYPCR